MKRFLLVSASLLALAAAVPVEAAQVNIGVGAAGGTITGGSAAAATPGSVASVQQAGAQTGFGVGFSATAPGGPPVTAGVGTTVTNSAVLSNATVGPSGGTAATLHTLSNNAAAVGIGAAFP